MKQMMLQEDLQVVQDRLRAFEKKTGCELLLIVAKAADEYPGASWRFGVIAATLTSVIFGYFFEFQHQLSWPLFFIVLTMCFVFVGNYQFFKRFALNSQEVDRETQEKAIELFHTLGSSKVSHKQTALILASVLEKRIVVLVDEKLKTELSQDELDHLVTIMQPHFKKGDMARGFISSIEALEEKILKDFRGQVSDAGPDELKNEIIFL